MQLAVRALEEIAATSSPVHSQPKSEDVLHFGQEVRGPLTLDARELVTLMDPSVPHLQVIEVAVGYLLIVL